MKKIINLKEIMLIIMVIAIVAMSTNVFATGLVLGDEDTTTITGNEYDNAQNIPEDEDEDEDEDEIDNDTTNNTANTTKNTSNNTAKKYNTNNTTDLPQTGIEDYNIGILLIICVASAMYAYKKVNDYKNI